MRHAPQSRFDRWKDSFMGKDFVQVEQRVAAYTLDQMNHWTETDWNWHMRKALEQQGFRTFHIREASENGVADLVVYRTDIRLTLNSFDTPVGREPMQVIEAWLELKKDNNKAQYQMDPRKASQRQFMREHWQAARNALYVMFDRKVGMLAVYQGDLRGRVKMYPPYPYVTKWQEVFDHFKAR